MPADDARASLTDRVAALLSAHEGVLAVGLYGSLANGSADVWSDIDLRVRLRGTSDRLYAEQVPELLRPIGAVIIEAWGPTALPDRFIRCMYFRDYPLFWHADVWCQSDVHGDGSDLKAMYHWPQMFRVWIDELKKVLRGAPDTRVMDSFARHWMDPSKLPTALKERLSAYLDRIYADTRSRGVECDEVFSRCDDLRQEYLATGNIIV